MEVFTIGVYNSTESEFFEKLINAHIDTFVDVRQRRGLRGSKYSFANSKKLQDKLCRLNIKYVHCIKLAPTTEIRDAQKRADSLKNNTKQNRKGLDEIFVNLYNQQIKEFSLDDFLLLSKNHNSQRIVLFCVEEKPIACHRSIIAEKLKTEFGCSILHL